MSRRKASAATPADVLRSAAYLVCIDGWDPSLPVEMRREPRNERYYKPSTLDGALIRAYRMLRASWMCMVRASEALYRALGIDHNGPPLMRKWERTPGRRQEHIERALLRAAYALEGA